MNERRRLGEHDGDGVEAHLVPGDTGAGGIAAGSANDVLLFIRPNRAIRGAEFGRSSGFHFHEDEDVRLAGDDIDFGIAFVGAEIAGDNGKAGISQITVGQIFASAAEGGFGREGAALMELASGIAQLPEELGRVDLPERSSIASSRHSITLPRTR